MANLVTGAMGSLIPKLGELLKEEYNLQTGMKKRIKSLTEELESAQAALRKVEMVPWDQLDEQVQIWARQVREASYDMEDILDTFLVCVKSPDYTKEKSLRKRLGKKITNLFCVKSPDSTKQKSLHKSLGKKITNLFTKSKASREISVNTKDIMSHLEEVTERCRRYQVGDIVVGHHESTVDPRLHAMYNKVEDLVGIDKSSSELISMLQSPQHKGASNLKKIVVIVGVGGLGKTTLAKAVYDKLKGNFHCTAFVPVGRKPNPQEVIKEILIGLDKNKYIDFNFAACHQIYQFIDELRNFLREKRYFIVIDDLWEQESWEPIKLAFDDNNCESRIIITTRNREICQKGYEVYDLPPLPDDSSRELFFIRIGHEGKLIDNKPNEVTVKFLKKCGGIPLAIITMASLLAGKPTEKWDDLYRSIGFGSEDNNQAQNTMRIVSFSYYDLPAHLRTCLLYLSAFPEDSIVPKDSLVWMWVAEGFVKKKQAKRLFETGEGYFHDLINRSMLEPVKSHNDDSIVTGCRVHDMVLDFICSMSDQENFFSIVLDNDQGPILQSNIVPRRLAHHHNWTMRHGRCYVDDLKMEKVRSMFAIGCGIQASDPFRGFMLLRVLVIDNYMVTEGSYSFQLEHMIHLLHLRFLSIRRTSVDRIPEEIGRLRFLQTLDLKESFVKECPSPGSLPEQLMCLCLPTRTIMHSNDGIFPLRKLTSLEELSISVSGQQVSWRLPTELRVLELCISGCIEATTERDLWESVHHLNKLEHLTILGGSSMHATDLLLPSQFWQPPCVQVLCLPNLSHLHLSLEHLDEHDLKMLGRLPELRFIHLELWTSATVSSVIVVSEKDAAVVYFPKLRCCQLWNLMISFHANKEEKSISFHMWGGAIVADNKLQRPIICCSSGDCSATAVGAPRGRFMPGLEVFRFVLTPLASWDDRCWDNLGFEYGLPSLREICVSTDNAAVRSVAEAHPNRPAVRVGPWWQS